MKLPFSGMNLDGFGESDEESFIREKVCALVVHSLTPSTAHVLYSSDDNPKAIHFKEYYETYKLLAAYLTVYDTQPSAGRTCVQGTSN
jgi:hypothetical protein